MLLQGSIHRFDLASVLQFLAQDAATGVLEVRDFEEYGFIYLVDGGVEGISLPVTDEKLGTRLLKAGCITELQLADALIEDSALRTRLGAAAREYVAKQYDWQQNAHQMERIYESMTATRV
jgi:glycosyltransferase involved in cell wall biosynthesis